MTNDDVTNQDTDTEKARDPYDALFKEVMTQLFSELRIPIKTEQEVSRKPRTIDVVITCTKEEIEKTKRGTPFTFSGQTISLRLSRRQIG